MATKKEIIDLFENFGVKPSLETFSDRKSIQKLVYLTEAISNVDLGFTFTWHIYGPYSPGLTRVMFEKEKGTPIHLKENSNELKKIRELKNFLGKDLESSDKLELIASLHYVLSVAKGKKSDNEALATFHKVKPQFSESEVNEYYKKIKPYV